MGFKWGCKPWGSPWGDPIKSYRSRALSDAPPRALIEWELRVPADADDFRWTFLVYVNGAFAGQTRDLSMIVTPSTTDRFYFEVFAVGPGLEALNVPPG